jgi:hypothetical protein
VGVEDRPVHAGSLAHGVGGEHGVVVLGEADGGLNELFPVGERVGVDDGSDRDCGTEGRSVVRIVPRAWFRSTGEGFALSSPERRANEAMIRENNLTVMGGLSQR